MVLQKVGGWIFGNLGKVSSWYMVQFIIFDGWSHKTGFLCSFWFFVPKSSAKTAEDVGLIAFNACQSYMQNENFSDFQITLNFLILSFLVGIVWKWVSRLGWFVERKTRLMSITLYYKRVWNPRIRVIPHRLIQNSKLCHFLATVCKTVCCILSDYCLSVL